MWDSEFKVTFYFIFWPNFAWLQGKNILNLGCHYIWDSDTSIQHCRLCPLDPLFVSSFQRSKRDWNAHQWLTARQTAHIQSRSWWVCASVHQSFIHGVPVLSTPFKRGHKLCLGHGVLRLPLFQTFPECLHGYTQRKTKLLLYVPERVRFPSLWESGRRGATWMRSLQKEAFPRAQSYPIHPSIGSRDWNKPLCLISSIFTACRSLREDSADAEREEAAEEEDVHKEVHPQPLLQRVFLLRSAIRVHKGEFWRVRDAFPSPSATFPFHNSVRSHAICQVYLLNICAPSSTHAHNWCVW